MGKSNLRTSRGDNKSDPMLVPFSWPIGEKNKKRLYFFLAALAFATCFLATFPFLIHMVLLFKFATTLGPILGYLIPSVLSGLMSYNFAKAFFNLSNSQISLKASLLQRFGAGISVLFLSALSVACAVQLAGPMLVGMTSFFTMTLGASVAPGLAMAALVSGFAVMAVGMYLSYQSILRLVTTEDIFGKMKKFVSDLFDKYSALHGGQIKSTARVYIEGVVSLLITGLMLLGGVIALPIISLVLRRPFIPPVAWLFLIGQQIAALPLLLVSTLGAASQIRHKLFHREPTQYPKRVEDSLPRRVFNGLQKGLAFVARSAAGIAVAVYEILGRILTPYRTANTATFLGTQASGVYGHAVIQSAGEFKAEERGTTGNLLSHFGGTGYANLNRGKMTDSSLGTGNEQGAANEEDRVPLLEATGNQADGENVEQGVADTIPTVPSHC